MSEIQALRRPQPWLTYSLIGLSVLLALWSQFGADFHKLQPFLISAYISPTLPEIFSGQIWRLVTPIFIHFGMIHLVFNMAMTFQLGQLLEWRFGWIKLGWMVLLTAVVSNLAEYAVSGPGFGGMSGVLFGLFGYVWLAGRINPRFGFQIHPTAAIMLGVWFVACWFNFFGLLGDIRIANFAHTAGLLTGLILAWIDSWR